MSECGFCHGEPVGNAATWLDGKERPPAPCPRCGETNVPTTPVTDEMRWTGAEAIWTEVDGPLAVGPEVQGHDRNLLRAQACLEAALPLVPSERRVAELQEENERLRLMAFSPLGDNHHNAALCPYCNPEREKLIDELREARAALGDRSPDA